MATSPVLIPILKSPCIPGSTPARRTQSRASISDPPSPTNERSSAPIASIFALRAIASYLINPQELSDSEIRQHRQCTAIPSSSPEISRAQAAALRRIAPGKLSYERIEDGAELMQGHVTNLWALDQQGSLKHCPGKVIPEEIACANFISPSEEVFYRLLNAIEAHFHHTGKDRIGYFLSTPQHALACGMILTQEGMRVFDPEQCSLFNQLGEHYRMSLYPYPEKTEAVQHLLEIFENGNTVALTVVSIHHIQEVHIRDVQVLQEIIQSTPPRSGEIQSGLHQALIAICFQGLKGAIASQLPIDRDFYLAVLESTQLPQGQNPAHHLFGIFYRLIAAGFSADRNTNNPCYIYLDPRFKNDFGRHGFKDQFASGDPIPLVFDPRNGDRIHTSTDRFKLAAIDAAVQELGL